MFLTSNSKYIHSNVYNEPKLKNIKPVTVYPVRTDRKIGRNELCPCGYTIKYKKCHGANIEHTHA